MAEARQTPFDKPCRFFNSATGCLRQGCRFLHVASSATEANASSTPPPRASTTVKGTILCKFFAAGNCRNGDQCRFSHDQTPAPAQNQKEKTEKGPPTSSLSDRAPSFIPKVTPTSAIYSDSNAHASSSRETIVVSSSNGYEKEEQDNTPSEPCGICMEEPVVYGILKNCDHVFCLDCLKDWRKAQRNNEDLSRSNVTKCCPVCRSESHFIMPSSRPYHGKMKELAIENYTSSLAEKPCRYFTNSKRSPRGPFCPFGDDCHYAHQLTPGDDRYKFNYGAQHMLHRRLARRRNGPGYYPRMQTARRSRPFDFEDEDGVPISYEERIARRILIDRGHGADGNLAPHMVRTMESLIEIHGVPDGYEHLILGEAPELDYDDFYDQGDSWGLDDDDENYDLRATISEDFIARMQRAGINPIRDPTDDIDDYDIDAFDDAIDDFDYIVDHDDHDYFGDDVFGLRRAFEEGYARADLADSDDGEVHSFDRRMIWEDGEYEDEDEVEDGSIPDQWDAVDARHRSGAPSPSSSLEERIWEIRNQQVLLLNAERFARAEAGWDMADAEAADLANSVDTGLHIREDDDDDEEEEEEEEDDDDEDDSVHFIL